MKMWMKVLLPLIVVVGVWVLIQSGGNREILAAEVKVGTAVDAVLGNIGVEPSLEVTLRSQESGAVIASLATPEDVATEVKQGDVLVRLDSRLLDLQITSLEKEIAAAEQRIADGSPSELTLQNLQQDLKIKQALSDIDQSSRSDLAKLKRDIAKLEREIAAQKLEWQTELGKLKGQLEQLKLRRENMVMLAPVDGTLTDVAVFPGDFIFQGDPVGVILSKAMTIRVSISEGDFAGVAVGQDVRARFPGIGGAFFSGTVTELAPTADGVTRRRDVIIALNEPPESGLVGGMTGEASIIKERRENAKIIPRRALLGDTVFVIDGGVIKPRKVEVGFLGLLEAEILSGLEAGEQVATDDLASLEAGQSVSITTED